MFAHRNLRDVLEYALPELRMLFEVSEITGIHVARLFERVLREGVSQYALGCMLESMREEDHESENALEVLLVRHGHGQLVADSNADTDERA